MDDREQALKRLHFISKTNPLVKGKKIAKFKFFLPCFCKEITDQECGDCFSDLCYIIQSRDEYSSQAMQTVLNMILDLLGASIVTISILTKIANIFRVTKIACRIDFKPIGEESHFGKLI